MAFLTTSLVLAARSDDPSHYNDPLDGFRLFSEVVTLLWVLFDLGLEFYELGGVVLVHSYVLNVMTAWYIVFACLILTPDTDTGVLNTIRFTLDM